MTEEARPVVKNNKLLQYPSGESTDRARASEGEGREKEKQKSRERTNDQPAPVTSLSVRFLRFSVHGGCPYAKG